MREMLLAAAVCGAFGLAIVSILTTGGNADFAILPSPNVEEKVMMTMMGAPYIVIDQRNDADIRRRDEQL